MVVWLYASLFVATYKILKISSDFQNCKIRMCFRPSWVTFIFGPQNPPPPPPPPPNTNGNEIIPDLAWHKLGPKTFFKFFVQFFFSKIYFPSPNKCSHQNKKSSKFKIIWTKMYVGRCCLACGHLWNFKNVMRFQKFQNQCVFQVILSNFWIFWPQTLDIKLELKHFSWDPEAPPPPPTITTKNDITPDLVWH